jgi:hypothetical protein
MFSDNDVEIDEKVFNAARIDKLVGTWAKKGADSTERPWRISDIVKVPNDLSPNDDALFAAVANLIPKEEPKPQPQRTSYSNAPFDLRSWLNEHGIKFREKSQGSATKYELEYCPWVDTHSDKKKWDSALFVDSQGKVTFNCSHSHCSGKTWHDVRLFYEPNAYDKPQYVPRNYYRQQYQQKPKYEIKEQVPELGGKWLSMSDIKKIDLSALKHVKTGFYELDRFIIGLYDSEVSLLSGSNSSGKSSWLNTLLLNIVNQGEKCALWSGELRSDILKSWLQMVAAGKNHLRLSQYGDGKYYVPNAVGEKIDKWLDGKFFLYNNDYGCQWEQIFHDMKELSGIGVKVFALDNLFSMNIDLLEGDKNNQQKSVILQLKDFAKKEQVHIILVVHPRKVTTFLRKNDISGTSDLTNAADNVFIIHRVNRDFFRTGAEFFGQSEIQKFQGYGNVIEVAKNRMYGVVDTMIGLHYEIESRRFKNSDMENIEYGWEREGTQTYMQYDNCYESVPDDMPFGRTLDEAPF